MPDKQLKEQLHAIWRVADTVSRQGADEAARHAAIAVLRHFSPLDNDGRCPSTTLAKGDLQWMCRTAKDVAPMVDIVRLLDVLASMGAVKERRKISLDLHDGTIQPYLGLKLGLESLRRKAGASNPLLADIDELCAMANESIEELRRYVRRLSGQPKEGQVSLLDLVRRQAERFRKFYGMEVEVNTEPGLEVTEELVADVVQIVGESLSNIGRHTLSRRVVVRLFRRGEHLVAQIINFAGESDEHWQAFTPASISQRAARLGGTVTVSPLRENGSAGTIVRVDIPMEAGVKQKLNA